MSKKINILIISHEPLTHHLKKMYCLDELKKDFNVEFWSLRKIFYSNNYKFENEIQENCIEFSNIYKFYLYLKKYKVENTYIFLDNSAFHLRSLIVYKIVKKYKLSKFILYKSFQKESDLIKKISTLDKMKSYLSIINLKKLIIRKLRINHYYFIFSSGLEKPTLSHNFFVPINNTIVKPKKYKIKKENYGVFIDQGYPTHPDLKKNGYFNTNVKSFIKKYNNFFDKIEDILDTKILIAKHPKSEIPNSFFKGREVVINKTEELIIKSRFVIGHFSYINSIAIDCLKPIILIYCLEMNKFPDTSVKQIIKLSKILNLNLINIDKKIDCNISLSVDKKKYFSFIKKYIRLNNKSNAELIKDEIMNDFDKT